MESTDRPGRAAVPSGASNRPPIRPPSPPSPLLSILLDCARTPTRTPTGAHIAAAIPAPPPSSATPTERVAFYFAEALSRRLSRSPSPSPSSASPLLSPEDFTLCYKTLNDACPYSKFAHLTANQAILEATASSPRIHIVDIGVVQGVQWAALLQALATRPAGKPSLVRISGVASPSLGPSAAASLAATGARLRSFAALLDLPFEFHPISTPIYTLSDADPGPDSLRVDPDESVAVNFMLHLHHLLADSPDPVRRALRLAKSLAPRVVTLGEYESDLNRAGFADRFAAALAYYSSVFDSLEPALADRASPDRVRVERLLLGRKILGALGPRDGEDRTERMAAREEWRALMEGSGLEPVRFSNYAVSQAKLLLWNYEYSAKYSLVESAPSFLSLAWDGRPLLTLSAWR
ncbi:scarecrow-like protein 4 [Ananas comosus]|uniref:Scarecrow-like protein 4 n=1 Tax=Ananas comosus TaxID=4615 RepID=A0A6P5G676_ANACO|nr:scarecrow-like protein 4 [Ananas comosus]